MQAPLPISISCTTHVLASAALSRSVTFDVYCPAPLHTTTPHLLLINDGQDLLQFNYQQMLQGLLASVMMGDVVCIGIHAGNERLEEYGIASTPDYAGRGAKAGAYHSFILNELLPFAHLHLGIEQFASKAFAGFSLGGLSAFDLVWRHPNVFGTAGVFSGSFWWRSQPLGPGYDDDRHRIMHQEVRQGNYHPGQRFYFTTGSLDETADRNNNGIIDSIDDTSDLVKELLLKGYQTDHYLKYLNYEDGRHDVATWGRVMPGFLLWAFANK